MQKEVVLLFEFFKIEIIHGEINNLGIPTSAEQLKNTKINYENISKFQRLKL